MTEPRFNIFDVVQIGDHPALAAADRTGQRGIVTQVQQHPGPRFRYMVRSLVDDDDDEIIGVYDEEHLQPTGERASSSLFVLPGGFRTREVVEISSAYDDLRVAGRVGVIDGTYTGEGSVGVRIEELAESVVVQPRFLTPTGSRLPAPISGRVGSSMWVTVDGQRKGQTTYIIVDDVDRHL